MPVDYQSPTTVNAFTAPSANNDGEDFATGLGVLAGQIDAATAQPGDLRLTARATLDTGWLACDGSPVSRATYAALFAAIGTAYGAGDGSTTFNLPDYRGRSPLGAGSGTGLTARARGAKGGEEAHSLTVGEMPSHNHGGVTGGMSANNPHNHGIGGPISTFLGDSGVLTGFELPASGSGRQISQNAATAATDIAHTHSVSSQGGGAAHNNMTPFSVCNVWIKT